MVDEYARVAPIGRSFLSDIRSRLHGLYSRSMAVFVTVGFNVLCCSFWRIGEHAEMLEFRFPDVASAA
jgi:hypothetical protein